VDHCIRSNKRENGKNLVERYIACSCICASYVAKERYTLRRSEYLQDVCLGMGAAKPEGASLHKKTMLAREGS
jgi:hypothetical protein